MSLTVYYNYSDRTMQTAVGVFGGGNYTDGIGASPLMVEGAGQSGRQAISSLNCPPFLAVEACREHMVFPSRRTQITHQQLFVTKYIIIYHHLLSHLHWFVTSY
jgi:hypothetical protein